MFGFRGCDRLFPFIDVIGAAAQPGQRHQLDAFVIIQAANCAQQLFAYRIIGLVDQDIGLSVIGRIGALIGIAVFFLHVIFARLDDDERNLVHRQVERGRRPAGLGGIVGGNGSHGSS